MTARTTLLQLGLPADNAGGERPVDVAAQGKRHDRLLVGADANEEQVGPGGCRPRRSALLA